MIIKSNFKDFYDHQAYVWDMTHSTENTKNSWVLADKIFAAHLENLSFGKRKLSKYCVNTFNLTENLNLASIESMLKKFKLGWVPELDSDWVNFKQSFRHRV